jgi:nucleoside-diphosphate-sugar epimerase
MYKTILITGGAGFVGSTLAIKLKKTILIFALFHSITLNGVAPNLALIV